MYIIQTGHLKLTHCLRASFQYQYYPIFINRVTVKMDSLDCPNAMAMRFLMYLLSVGSMIENGYIGWFDPTNIIKERIGVVSFTNNFQFTYGPAKWNNPCVERETLRIHFHKWYIIVVSPERVPAFCYILTCTSRNDLHRYQSYFTQSGERYVIS